MLHTEEAALCCRHMLKKHHLCCITHSCTSPHVLSLTFGSVGGRERGKGRQELINQTKVNRSGARLSCSVASCADRWASVNQAVLQFLPVCRVQYGFNLLSCLKQPGTFSDLKFSCTDPAAWFETVASVI